ncbi:MAG: isocitrate/isopropylmalate dehydrogenase family protein [Elusimicrobiota bacterium]|nr:isocitrate/isopropylmalate dehydrogenase family protein [Endomicrobiia bacterium]MDW8166366.1 isocitrate/isopropylmalate dehydrogenase family protein [Elusimicrobiota bacterium]
MKHKVTLIPGDGVGPELIDIVKKIVSHLVEIEWEEVEVGEDALKKYGDVLPSNVIESIKKNKVALKGPVTTPIGSGFRSVNVALRQILNLYACVRPCKTYPGINTKYENVDIVIIRENTEDLYAGVEFQPFSEEANYIISKSNGKISKDCAISIKAISPSATRKIAKFAFEYAVKNNRKKVTSVTKANILKYTDGLFFEVCREVAKEYPQIEYEEKLIDNMCMQLVQKPQMYDVLLLPNLYGDIVSDLCAGLVGGLGVAPGANFGDEYALFEAVHGSAPKYKGLNKVNPTALLLSAKMMLEYLGENEAANRLENAIIEVIKEAKVITYDLGGNSKNTEMAEEIIRKLGS